MLSWELSSNTTCSLNGLMTTEIIPSATLDLLISSSLLKEVFHNIYVGRVFKNEKQQMLKLRSNLNGDLSKIKYERTKGMSYGRVNPVGSFGLYSIRRELRHTLARDNYVDIDIDNAHPVFCLQYCKANSIPCETIEDYVNNRDQWLEKVADAYLKDYPQGEKRDAAKKLFIRVMYHGSFSKWIKEMKLVKLLEHRALNNFISDFADEIANVADIIIKNNEKLRDEIAAAKLAKGQTEYNVAGSNASYFFQHIECQLLETMYTYAKSKGLIENGMVVLCADGLMLRKSMFYPALLDEFKAEILVKHRLNVGVSQKLMTQGYSMEQIMDAQIAEVESTEPTYDEVKMRFEKVHAKIVNKSLFIKEGSDFLFFSEKKLKTSYRDIKYYEEDFDKKGKSRGVKPFAFIDKWMNDEKMRKYEDMEVYPPPLVCPSDMFNLWKPFYISKFTGDYVKNEVALAMFLSHVLILCGNDQNVADYIVKWIAQMFQFPATKTIVPTFISEEGAGKGSLIELLASMLGGGKTLVTTTPSRDVWGHFNSLMNSYFFINLNEMAKKETLESEGKIKGLITDPQLTINKKGVDVFTIISYHRFFITTNKEDPIKTKKGDRRNLIIRSSDELCADKYKEYFVELRQLFKDLAVQRTIYDYLMAIPDLDKFNSLPRPSTEYQDDMKEANRSVFCRWIEDLAIKSKDDLLLSSTEQLDMFIKFCNSNGITYETSAIQMGMAIKRLNIPGVEAKHTRDGNVISYNIADIREHYKLDCQV